MKKLTGIWSVQGQSRIQGSQVRQRFGFVGRRALTVLFCLALLLPFPGAAFASVPEIFPEIIPLPDGFRPEGIAVGRRATFYSGSLANGSIYEGNLITGEGSILVPPQPGRVAVGLDYDRRTNYIYVAGGSGGGAYVYDAGTGEEVAVFQFATGSTFINDVVVTLTAAYFTDSSRPFIYRVPLSLSGGLPDPSDVEAIELTGDFTFIPDAFNANGIDAIPGGKLLVIVHTSLGTLYVVDPKSGHTIQIDLGEDSVPNGDGILLDGRTLYVVQNFLNQISVIKLHPRSVSGEVVRVITDPDFRIPTGVDEFGNALYVVNARFDIPPTPDTEYEIVRVPKH